MTQKKTPLVLLCLDAADHSFIQKWAQEGYLPTIASVMKRGSWGNTAGAELISEHGVWVSLFSGISRSQHGYYYFRQMKPGTYDLESVSGYQIDAPPFWAHLRGDNRKVVTIDVPDTPPIPDLPGIQLANWDSHQSWAPDLYVTATEPPELLDEIHRKYGKKLSQLEVHHTEEREDRKLYGQFMDHIHLKGQLCCDLAVRDSFDLFVITFCETHAANHQFWKYYNHPRETSETPPELSVAIRNVYQEVDRQLGILLEKLPKESNVFILSSVGMEDSYPADGLMEDFLKKLGYQKAADAEKISFRPIDIVRKITPESLRIAISHYLPRENREGFLADQFRKRTNWSETAAFTIPSTYTSFVRVNLRGREPEGIIEAGAEYHALLNRIESDLKQLTDPITNKPAVAQIYKTTEVFDCPPHISLPDMFVKWQSGRFLERVVHPRAEIVQSKPDFFRPSDHSTSGFIAAAGPDIMKQEDIGTVAVLDLAPTFFRLLNLAQPKLVRGKPIAALLKN